jgi:hypothetical protein
MMKYCLLSIVVLGLLAAFYAVRARRAPLSVTIESDLDGDGKTERVVLNAANEKTLSVWRGDKRLWQDVPKKWQPWKLTTADVDGDGKREILLGVYKPTRFFPKPHNCLFVYGWDGKQAFPKWLGSSLARPFTDFTSGNLDDDRADELVSVEVTRDNKRCIAVYSWNQFGFVIDWQRGAWDSICLLEVKQEKIVVRADGRQIMVREKRTPKRSFGPHRVSRITF